MIPARWLGLRAPNILGAGAFSLGITPSEFTTRDLTPPDDVAFFFPFGSLTNFGAQNPSAFLFVRTNATDFGPGQVVVSGAGTTPPIASFAPTGVPEPSSALFGFGLIVSAMLNRPNRAGPRVGRR